MRRASNGGATIRYTLDGSEPTETSLPYTKSFNVFDTTTVKAKAFKDGCLPSATATARYVRLQTLPEAIDQPLWTVTTGGDVDWTVDTETSYDGKSAAVCTGVEPEEASWMQTTVEGAGTLSFRWRVICEDDPDNDAWDFLMLEVDGLDVAHVDGVSNAEEYVMGTDPNDPESRLMAFIEIVDGQPVVTYTPDLLDDRRYIKWGKKDLADPNEEWVPVPAGQEGNYNFFKVTVEMP